MKKIGILLENNGIEDIDMSNLKSGNPGVGGSQYHLFLLNQLLFQKNYNNVIFLDKEQEGVSNSVSFHDFDDLIKQIKKTKIQFFIIWPKSNEKYKKLFSILSNQNIKIITWAHNMINPFINNYLLSCKSHFSHVVVSRQQKIRLYGSNLYKKTIVISNIYCEQSESFYNQRSPNDKKINIVYIGSIVKEKGLHILTSAWPEIKRKLPDAHLHVIGSGALYSRKNKLGQFNIAEHEYEKLILKPIIHNGKLDNSITFHGALGSEKWNIIKTADVGIINPSGKSENCPGSALDFQSINVPVVSKRINGLIDTVLDKQTGFLFKDQSKIASYVVKAYKLDVKKRGEIFVKNNYSIEKIINLWSNLINEKNHKFNLIGKDFFLNNNWLKISYGFIFKKNLIFLMYRIFK